MHGLPEREVRDLPDPPRNYWRLVGPGIVAGGVGQVVGGLVARTEEVVRASFVQVDRAADVCADLGEAEDALVVPVVALLRPDLLWAHPHQDHRGVRSGVLPRVALVRS